MEYGGNTKELISKLNEEKKSTAFLSRATSTFFTSAFMASNVDQRVRPSIVRCRMTSRPMLPDILQRLGGGCFGRALFEDRLET